MLDLHEQFHAKIREEDGHWLWTGALSGGRRGGYGRFRTPEGRRLAHRVSWELHRGHIPVGLVIDHLCRVRHCVNPQHLRVVTGSENLRAGIGCWGLTGGLCRNGLHDITIPANVRFASSGRRQCAVCYQAKNDRWNEEYRRRRALRTRQTNQEP